MLDVEQYVLDERRALGLDGHDEMWEGELHIVPPEEFGHQEFGGLLLMAIDRIRGALGLRSAQEAGVFDPKAGERDYRVPDLVIARPENVSRRGVEGRAVMAVEIRSPDDETYEKIPFYARVGVEELLVIDRDTRAVELFVRVGDKLRPQAPNADGWLVSPALGLAFRQVGDRLAVCATVRSSHSSRRPTGTSDVAAPAGLHYRRRRPTPSSQEAALHEGSFHCRRLSRPRRERVRRPHRGDRRAGIAGNLGSIAYASGD